MLREAYMEAAENLTKKVRDGQAGKVIWEISKFKVGDLVLLTNHKKHTPWDAKYMSNFHICKVINDRPYDLQNPSGHVCHNFVEDIQLLIPAEYIVTLLPDAKVFGRA